MTKPTNDGTARSKRSRAISGSSLVRVAGVINQTDKPVFDVLIDKASDEANKLLGDGE